MSDRTSAEIFSQIFIMLAEGERQTGEILEKNYEWAHRFMKMAQQYDFNGCQMGDDAAMACVALNVAKKTSNPDYDSEYCDDDEKEIIVYKYEDY